MYKKTILLFLPVLFLGCSNYEKKDPFAGMCSSFIYQLEMIKNDQEELLKDWSERCKSLVATPDKLLSESEKL